MGKWFGNVGFNTTGETDPGVWEQQVTPRPYYGDVISNRWKRQSSSDVNDSINVSNSISIVADAFANENCSDMLYIEFMGTKWKITDIEPQYPRILITMGGVYNGQQTSTAE